MEQSNYIGIGLLLCKLENIFFQNIEVQFILELFFAIAMEKCQPIE